MRILFIMEHSGIGPLVPALRLLHERGHEIHLAARRVKTGHSQKELEALADECPRITYWPLPRHSTPWTRVARSFRYGIDYLRYLEPRYREARKLRARAEARSPRAVRLLGRIMSSAGSRGVVALSRSLQAVERSIPPPPGHARFLVDTAPDVVLITPLVDLGSRQADWLRAAKRLGIRTAYPVFSWDNLTNKGLLRDLPDRVLVWNDLQEREAVELHRVPPERIRVTGAPVCDPWFEWEPSRSREAFCGEVGLRADRPIVLYVCSSQFVAPDEATFVRSWIERLRGRVGVLADAGILIRPYPDTSRRWLEAMIEGPQVRVWPRSGEAPHDAASRRNYFDSIFHAAAVMGINTTAQIESAIVGRPVHTLLAPEFRETQEGTLHFQYLEADEFGLLFVGRDFEEHAAQLEASLRGRVDGRNDRFVRRFVRPLGSARPARELVAEAIEELGAAPAPVPDRGPRIGPVVRAALTPLVTVTARDTGRQRVGQKKPQSPTAQLRRTVERLRQGRGPSTLVAGPWLEDEIGELLYWIPFLRWVQGSSIGLRERLYVVCRASSAAWYDGIGAARAEVPGEQTDSLEDLVEAEFGLDAERYGVLPAAAVAASRAEIAAQDPTRRIQHRLVEFAPLAAPEPPSDLPDVFLAVSLDARRTALRAALGAHASLVDLEAYDRPTQTAVLARARGFVGAYGPEAYLALLLGTAAVVVGVEDADPVNLRIAAAYLDRPPFGALHVIDALGRPGEIADRAVALLGSGSTVAARV